MGSGWFVASSKVPGYVMDAVLSNDERYLITVTSTGVQLIQILNENLQFDVQLAGFIPLQGRFLRQQTLTYRLY